LKAVACGSGRSGAGPQRKQAWRVALLLGCALAADSLCAVVQADEGARAELQHVALWSFYGGLTSHELSSPGLHAGVEYALATTRHFQSLAAASLQAYSEADTEAGYALHARWGHRYTAGFGLTFESHLGIGAQYTRWDTTVFVFRGAISRAEERSRSGIAFSPHVVFGPGYDFERAFGLPLHLYLRPGVVLIYPDLNDAFQAAVIAELGLRWTPSL
jgi:hypothetical protein